MVFEDYEDSETEVKNPVWKMIGGYVTLLILLILIALAI